MNHNYVSKPVSKTASYAAPITIVCSNATVLLLALGRCGSVFPSGRALLLFLLDLAVKFVTVICGGVFRIIINGESDNALCAWLLLALLAKLRDVRVHQLQQLRVL